MRSPPKVHNRKTDMAISLARAALWIMATTLLPLVQRRPKSRVLRKLVAKAEYYFQFVLLLAAAQQAAPPSRRLRGAGVFARKPGFKVRARRASRSPRPFTHGAGFRLKNASLEARLNHIVDVLRDSARVIARMARRLTRGLTFCWLIAKAPPALVFCCEAAAPPPISSDTS